MKVSSDQVLNYMYHNNGITTFVAELAEVVKNNDGRESLTQEGYGIDQLWRINFDFPTHPPPPPP